MCVIPVGWGEAWYKVGPTVSSPGVEAVDVLSQEGADVQGLGRVDAPVVGHVFFITL